MRKILVVILVPVFLIAAVLALFLVMPLDSLRGPMERAVSKALGRQVHIAGALHASLYPEIGLSAGDVSIANVPGGQASVFAHAGTLSVGANLVPLLSRKVEITRLTLEDPEIHLEVDAKGDANWNFKLAGSTSSGSSSSSELSISGLKITGGSISYSDARTGKTKALEKANMNLSLAALDQPAVFDVDALYNGEKLAVTGRVDSPNSFTRKQPTKVLLDLKSRLLNLHFDGIVIGATQNSGKVEMSGPSLRELVKTGSAAVKTGGMGAFTFAGTVSSREKIYALKDGKASLDGMHLTVDLVVDTFGKVPSLEGKIGLDHLNLATYMVASKPAAASRGWSSEPLSVSGLKDANADIGITVGSLTLGNFVISQGAGHLTLQDGKLTADLARAGLFGGTMSGRLAVDATEAVPAIALKADVSGVAMKALLQSAIKVERLEGTGALAMAVSGYGANQQAIMSGLRGTASLTVKNGAIRGVDLAAVARSVQNVLSGALGMATSGKASTDFAEAGASFAIVNGVMHTSDFHLLNPFVRIAGSGDIDLGQRTLNFRVEPKAVLNREGQGGAQNATGLGVPFLISGPWTKPSYRPDMKAVAGALLDQVTKGNGGLSGLLGGVLGGKKTDDAAQKKPGLDLGSLFGR